MKGLHFMSRPIRITKPAVTPTAPVQFSNPLKVFQQRIGVEPDGAFGPTTFKAAKKYLNLTHEQAVHFFAQCAHETGEFTLWEENLNYSASSLRRVFKKYYKTDAAAKAHARKPKLIGDTVYGGRMGNAPDEGYKFRGRGAIQLTGRDNYEEFAEAMNNPAIVTNPDIVELEYAFESALFYFNKNNLWRLTKDLSYNTCKKVTRAVNGGYNGLEHRWHLTNIYADW